MNREPKLTNKNARQFHKMATRQYGFELIKWGNHLTYRLEGAQELLVVSSTPSDHRAMKNATARMKRIARSAT